MASFEKLLVYQKALEFSNKIYTITNKWPKSELFGLTSQIRRAAISIALNIAEGSSRTHKDFCHFLTIARGSCYECIAILTLSLKLRLLTKDVYDECYTEVETIAKMINGLKKAF